MTILRVRDDNTGEITTVNTSNPQGIVYVCDADTGHIVPIQLTPGSGLSGLMYSSYVALISQTGEQAPVATVLENNLGYDVLWARSSQGQYQASLDGSNFPNTTAVFMGTSIAGILSYGLVFAVMGSNNASVNIDTIVVEFSGPVPVIERRDGLLDQTPIEIRIY